MENCLDSEFVHRYIIASPTVTPLPVPGGWYESSLMYSCLFVGLMCVLVCSVLFSSLVDNDVQEDCLFLTAFVCELYGFICLVHMLDELFE